MVNLLFHRYQVTECAGFWGARVGIFLIKQFPGKQERRCNVHKYAHRKQTNISKVILFQAPIQ